MGAGRKIAIITTSIILGAAILSAIVVAVDYNRYTAHTAAMAPTIRDGDPLFAEPLDGHRPKRGDIVVFETYSHPGLVRVSRVVAVGGDTVDTVSGKVRVNGNVVDEPYLVKGSTTDFPATTLYVGSVWVMGDNRNNAADSRAEGPVLESSIRGRVEFVGWPLQWIAIGIAIVAGIVLLALLLWPRRGGTEAAVE